MLERVERHNRAAAPGRRVRISVELEKPRQELLPLMRRGHVVRGRAMRRAMGRDHLPKGVAGASAGREWSDLRGARPNGSGQSWSRGVRARGVPGWGVWI